MGYIFGGIVLIAGIYEVNSNNEWGWLGILYGVVCFFAYYNRIKTPEDTYTEIMKNPEKHWQAMEKERRNMEKWNQYVEKKNKYR